MESPPPPVLMAPPIPPKLLVRKIQPIEYQAIANEARLWQLNAIGYWLSEFVFHPLEWGRSSGSKKWPLFQSSEIACGVAESIERRSRWSPLDVHVCETLDGKIQGIMVGSLQNTCPEKTPFPEDGSCYNLDWLMANPSNLKCRKEENMSCISGAGKALLESAESRAQELGCDGVVLKTATGAEGFYRKCNYQSNDSTFYKRTR